jgi:hypothetical protein
VKVYFTENEAKLVEGIAGNESISGFIRRTVLNNLYAPSKIEATTHAKRAAGASSTSPTSEVAKRGSMGVGDRCKHGKEPGSFCLDCGGVAHV